MRRNLPIGLIVEVPGVFRCPIVVPTTPWQRLRGIRGAPPGHGVLLAAAAVNSIGLNHPTTVLALDEKGRVLAIRHLAPNTMWRHSGATWMLELHREALAVSGGADPGSRSVLAGCASPTVRLTTRTS